MALGRYWQGRIRALLGMPPDGLASLVVMPLVAALVLVILVALARVLRRVYRWTAHTLERWIGPRAARATGWTAVVAGTALLVSGVLLDGLVAAADAAFSVRNGTTEPGVVQPIARERSGSPESQVSWTSLGQQGRSFTGTGPSVEQIAAFTRRRRAHADPGLRRSRVRGDRRATRPDRRRRPRPGGRVRPPHAGGGDGHRLGMGGPGRGGLGRVHDRRRHRDGVDPVLLPPVVVVLPGRSGSRARGRPGALRRGVRPVVEAARGPSAGAGRRRREPRFVRRGDGVQRRVRPPQPHGRSHLRRAAELQHPLPGVRRRARTPAPRR